MTSDVIFLNLRKFSFSFKFLNNRTFIWKLSENSGVVGNLASKYNCSGLFNFPKVTFLWFFNFFRILNLKFFAKFKVLSPVVGLVGYSQE